MLLHRHLVKNSRKLRWRLKPKSVPLHWLAGRPNFGDDINPYLFQALGTGINVRLAQQTEPHFLGMGSVLGNANAQSVVLGSGFISPENRLELPEYKKIVVVRGQYSLQDLQLSDPEILLGDPMILCHRLLERPLKRDIRVGLVYHRH